MLPLNEMIYAQIALIELKSCVNERSLTRPTEAEYLIPSLPLRVL